VLSQQNLQNSSLETVQSQSILQQSYVDASHFNQISYSNEFQLQVNVLPFQSLLTPENITIYQAPYFFWVVGIFAYIFGGDVASLDSFKYPLITRAAGKLI